MTYPPGPQNPYGQQPPAGSTPNPYAQQPPQVPQQPGYGAPQAPQGYGYPPPQPGAYGYPPQGPPPGAFGYTPAGPAVRPPGVPMPSSEYAHWGLRVGALLIDGITVGLIPFVLIIIGAAMSGSSSCSSDPDTGIYTCTSSTSGGGTVLLLLGCLVALVAGLFMIYMEGKSGQTLGRKALKITLVRESDGMPLGFGMAFVRRLAHFLDNIACYLGWLWPIWDDKKQTFADKVTSSVVMRTIGQ